MLPPNQNTPTNLIVYTDGGARGNPGPAASAYLIFDQAGQLLHQDSKYLGETTNNVAEYTAVLLAATYLVNSYPQVSSITFYLDSKLVAEQLSHRFKIKSPPLISLYAQITQLITNLNVKFLYLPRSQNTQADRLVNLCLDQQIS